MNAKKINLLEKYILSICPGICSTTALITTDLLKTPVYEAREIISSLCELINETVYSANQT